jgi:hypothetical protein
MLFAGGPLLFDPGCMKEPPSAQVVREGDFILKTGAEPYEVGWKSLTSAPTRAFVLHLDRELLLRTAEELARCGRPDLVPTNVCYRTETHFLSCQSFMDTVISRKCRVRDVAEGVLERRDLKSGMQKDSNQSNPRLLEHPIGLVRRQSPNEFGNGLQAAGECIGPRRPSKFLNNSQKRAPPHRSTSGFIRLLQ